MMPAKQSMVQQHQGTQPRHNSKPGTTEMETTEKERRNLYRTLPARLLTETYLSSPDNSLAATSLMLSRKSLSESSCEQFGSNLNGTSGKGTNID
jgi:hypothetical protein